jgi:hypothetical protein
LPHFAAVCRSIRPTTALVCLFVGAASRGYLDYPLGANPLHPSRRGRRSFGGSHRLPVLDDKYVTGAGISAGIDMALVLSAGMLLGDHPRIAARVSGNLIGTRDRNAARALARR